MASILVVDDSLVDRELMKGLLNVADFEVGTAESSERAIYQLQSRDYDLVVTDLQMPDMDGLELVKSINGEFPNLPSILVTAHGSEDIATTALDQGAAGYVPKSELSTKLVETVRNTLILMRADRGYASLMQHTTLAEFHFSLDHQLENIPPVVDLAQQMISSIGHRNPVERVRLGVALEQALLNALFHGNLEIGPRIQIPSPTEEGDETFKEVVASRIADPTYRDRRTKVELVITRNECKFMVRDEGEGFQPPDTTAIEQGAGRGLVLIRSFMDRVDFNEAGNEITMTRRWDRTSFTDSGRLYIQQFDDTGLDSNISDPHYGQLVSERSGRIIPLTEKRLVIGRRKSCHIVLPFREVSAHHCQMYVVEGFWFVKDLDSGNGIRINGKPVRRGRLDPGDTLTVAKYNYHCEYTPQSNE